MARFVQGSRRFKLSKSDKQHTNIKIIDHSAEQGLRDIFGRDTSMNQGNSKYCYLHPASLEDLVCTYPTCQHKLICQECAALHRKIHSDQFIYKFEDLLEIHSSNKFAEIKKEIVSQKIRTEEALEARIGTFYGTRTLADVAARCQNEMAELVRQKLKELAKNIKDTIIQYQQNITKSELANPERIIGRIVKELSIEGAKVEDCKADVREANSQMTEWVEKALEELNQFNDEMDIICETIERRKDEILRKMHNNFRADRSIPLDISDGTLDRNQSFQQKYNNMKRVTWQNQRLSSEVERLNKRLMDGENKNTQTHKEIQKLLGKIHELQIELENANKRWNESQKSKEREELLDLNRQKTEREKLDEILVKKGVEILKDPKEINLAGKGLILPELQMMIKNLPSITTLDLSDNRIPQNDLVLIFKFKHITVLRLNHMRLSADFLRKLSLNYRKLDTLFLESNNITDDQLSQICRIKLRVLSLTDNRVTDLGVSTIANKLQDLEELYLSYNSLTFKSADFISRSLFRIKILHLAKNQIRNQGLQLLIKGLRQLEELFVGGCEITKAGVLAIPKSAEKLKRLSLGKNHLTTDSIFQLITYLPDLEWLDISYSGFTPIEISKLKKIASTNQNLILVSDQ